MLTYGPFLSTNPYMKTEGKLKQSNLLSCRVFIICIKATKFYHSRIKFFWSHLPNGINIDLCLFIIVYSKWDLSKVIKDADNINHINRDHNYIKLDSCLLLMVSKVMIFSKLSTKSSFIMTFLYVSTNIVCSCFER